MRRWFFLLALVAGLLLSVDLIASGAMPRTLTLIGLVAMVLTHCLAAIDLESIGRQVETIAFRNGLPDWVVAQSEKNWRKSALFVWLGLPMVSLLFLAQHKGWVVGAWLIGLKAFNLAFQMGAILGELMVMTAQANLLRDVAQNSQQVAGSGSLEGTSF